MYDTYSFSKKEGFIYGLQSMGIIGMFGYFFYGSVKWALLLSPLMIVLLRKKRRELCIARKQELLRQFKSMLVSLNNAVSAGYSLENALQETYKDMLYFYKESSLIVKELEYIRLGMKNGRAPEILLEELGDRSETEDISDFAGILSVGKKCGGNMNEIIKTGISVIEEKIETKQKIQTMLSAGKLEAKIMRVIPFFVIWYTGATSKGYFDSLYQTWAGQFFMTGCLIIYLIAVWLSEKITEIEI